MKHSTALLITTLVLWSDWAESADPGDPEPAKTAQAPGNLLPNGDFSNGKTTPLSWQTIDGLSTYWVNDQDPQHGKVLKFDSDGAIVPRTEFDDAATFSMRAAVNPSK